MAMDTGWDEELLRVEIESLQELGYDPLLTGFDEEELAALYADDSEAQEDDFDVDAELQKPCFGKVGDIWRLGRHTVICGGSTDPGTFEELLGNTRVNLENKSGKIANDDLNDKETCDFLIKVFTNFKVGAGLIWKNPRVPFMRTDWKFNMEPIAQTIHTKGNGL